MGRAPGLVRARGAAAAAGAVRWHPAREYPSLRGRGRLEEFPRLDNPGREYSPAREDTDRDPAPAHLAGYAVPRRVDVSGKASLYDRYHHVGVIHRGETVHAMLDPEAREWMFADERGRPLCRRPAAELARESILGPTVTRRRDRTRGR